MCCREGQGDEAWRGGRGGGGWDAVERRGVGASPAQRTAAKVKRGTPQEGRRRGAKMKGRGRLLTVLGESGKSGITDAEKEIQREVILRAFVLEQELGWAKCAE